MTVIERLRRLDSCAVSDARDHEQDAEDAREEARPHHADPERKQPEPPEDLRDRDSLGVQLEGEVREGVPRARADGRQDGCAAAGLDA